MRQTAKLKGFVLKKQTLLNKDLVISFFSQEYGLIRIFAKGIRKITSRRLPHIETANLLDVVISQKSEYFYLQETKLISGFTQIKTDRSKLKRLYIFLFVLDKILPQHQKEDKIYQLFKAFMIDLSRKNAVDVVLTAYLNKVIAGLGYQEEDKKLDELIVFIEDLIDEKIPVFDI